MTEAFEAPALAMALTQSAMDGGGYFSAAKIAGMIVLVLPWLWLAPKVSQDALKVRAPHGLWSGIILGSGAAAVLIWLIVPIYLVGMLVYLAAVTTAYLSYLSYRNNRVLEDKKFRLGDLFANLFKKKEPVPQVMPISRVKLYNFDSKSVSPPPPGTEDREVLVYNLVQEFLYNMLARRASEVDIAPAEQQARVTSIIDGLPVEGAPLNLIDSEAIVQYIKPLAGLSVEERCRPQRGKILVDLAQGATEIVVTTAGTTGGQRMQFKIRQEIIQTRLAELGMSQEILADVRRLSETPGLIIVSGRSGSGVSSTLYSLLREHDAYTKQITTFEKEKVVDLENITQTTYTDQDNIRMMLASALRREPDVVMFDQCDSGQLAQDVAEAAAERIFLLGMSASDTFVAMAKWVKLVGNADPALQNLRGILCQMLVRKLCLSCREAYRPDPQMLQKLNLHAKGVDILYRVPARPRVDEQGAPIICPNCQGLGYYGRTAVFEWLEVTDEVRQLVVQGAPAANIKSACRKNRMLYLQEQALAKVLEGATSIQEVIRVSQQAKPAVKK